MISILAVFDVSRRDVIWFSIFVQQPIFCSSTILYYTPGCAKHILLFSALTHSCISLLMCYLKVAVRCGKRLSGSTTMQGRCYGPWTMGNVN